MNKKDFKISENFITIKANKFKEIRNQLLLDQDKPNSEKSLIIFPAHPGSIRSFDFSKLYGFSIDNISSLFHAFIKQIYSEKKSTLNSGLAWATISSYCKSIPHFLKFCSEENKCTSFPLNPSDLNDRLMRKYIYFLSVKNYSTCTQKNRYSEIKSILKHMVQRKIIENIDFPLNPYPKSNRSQKGEKPLCTHARKSISKALNDELRGIKKNKKPMTPYEISICVLTISLRTGLNTAPLLELPTNCISPHPLNTNQYILKSFKRRGNNTHIQSIKKSSTTTIHSEVMPGVDKLINLIIERNHSILKGDGNDKLFTYIGNGRSNGKKMHLTSNNLTKHVKNFVTKHNLTDSEGNPIRLNIMTLRKTFENRIWEISGNDPYITASMNNHSLKVSNDNYLEAPPDAEKNWRLMGEIRVQKLLGEFEEKTPIASCKSDLFKSKPGLITPCTSFLNCYRCRNFVVTKDDLFRLYSFYWLLVRERKYINIKKWKRYYSSIIRCINEEISPKFSHADIERNRSKAKTNPHPYWGSRELLSIYHEN